MCCNCLFPRGELAITFFFSAINRGEGSRIRSELEPFSLAPLFLPLRQLGGEKWESRMGRADFIVEGDPWAKQGETHTLAVRAVCLRKQWNAECPAWATWATQHLQQHKEICSRKCAFCDGRIATGEKALMLKRLPTARGSFKILIEKPLVVTLNNHMITLHKVYWETQSFVSELTRMAKYFFLPSHIVPSPYCFWSSIWNNLVQIILRPQEQYIYPQTNKITRPVNLKQSLHKINEQQYRRIKNINILFLEFTINSIPYFIIPHLFLCIILSLVSVLVMLSFICFYFGSSCFLSCFVKCLVA